MRKRLAIVFCMMMMSLLSLVGCGGDPYSKAYLSTPSIDDVSQVQSLLIKENDELGADSRYIYPEIALDVQVNNYGDMNTDLIVSGWEGFFTQPEIEPIGEGLSRITAKVLSEENTGACTLTVRMAEGNVEPLQVKYSIGLKIDSFSVNSDKIAAVGTDYELNLDEIEGLISFVPDKTTQTDTVYSVAIPSVRAGDLYSIDGRISDIKYIMDEGLVGYIQSGYKYAEVITNAVGQHVLRVYPYFVGEDGNYVLVEGKPVPTVFPQIVDETLVGGENVSTDTITIKVTNTALEAMSVGAGSEYVDIEVVPSIGETIVKMDGQTHGETVTINPDKTGAYNVVLVNPDFSGGLVSGEENAYFINRTLTFEIMGVGYKGANGEVLDVYRVANTSVRHDEGSQKPVDIDPVGLNIFHVSSFCEGVYSHKFVIEHTNEKYKGKFDKEIVINFKVISVPFNISVNGIELSSDQPSDMIYTLYDEYARGTYGTKFKVNTGSDFGYFLYIPNESTQEYINNGLIVRRDGDGGVMKFALEQDIASPEAKYTVFNSASNFYLRHSFENFKADSPSETLTVYIGIKFNVRDNSYSDELKSKFSDLLLSFPINFTAEKGITSIKFLQDKYYLSLNNLNYLYGEYSDGSVISADTGLLLWELPAGRTYENTIKSITYNEELVKVYSVYDEGYGTTGLYVKSIDNLTVGRTDVVIETLNGIVGSVVVETYIPTSYVNKEDMPLSITLDKYSSGFLYYMSGKDELIHDEQFDLYNVEGRTIDYTYDSVDTLFMITNAEQEINFYDYQIVDVDHDHCLVRPIDITSSVTVTFNYDNYLSYSRGVITSNSLVTLDIDAPIMMTIRYSTGYEGVAEDGSVSYYKYTVIKKIKVYVYNPLEGVEITSAKAVELYISDSLGYYNQDLSEHTIVSTYIPNKINLGAQWNERFDERDIEFEAVELWYDYQSLLDSNIITSAGTELTIMSMKGEDPFVVKYSDLFEIPPRTDAYELRVKSIMSERMDTWLSNNGYTSQRAKSIILQDYVFAENIEFVVNVYITQFQRLQNINSVKIKSDYATRITSLKLDVEDDGVVFEVKQDKNKEWHFSQEYIEVAYTIDNANVLNNAIVLQNYVTSYYVAQAIPNVNGNGGIIRITPKLAAGIDYLVVTTEDNIKNKADGGGYEYYDMGLVLSFRVKVSDGSQQYPFEIRTVDDYVEMYNLTSSGVYYNYILTRDLDFKGYDLSGLNVVGTNNVRGCVYSLSGKHSYYKNGVAVSGVFSSIYNLTITRNVNSTEDVYIGLFGQIDSVGLIDNLSIVNAKINVNELKDNTGNIFVGIIAGSAGCDIVSSRVSGSIVVNHNGNAPMSVGGMVGDYDGRRISGRPESYEQGIMTTGNNAYVDIAVSKGEDYKVSNESLVNIGGVVGYLASDNATVDLSDMQVVVNITSTVKSKIGGVVGLLANTNSIKLSKLDVLSTLTASVNDPVSTGYGLILGGMVGQANGNVEINKSELSYIDIGDDSTYTWADRATIYVSAQNQNVLVGGLIGLASNKADIKTTYVRSYYERKVSEDYYIGDIVVYGSSESVIGGLVGSANNAIISKSYFDGNIVRYSGNNSGIVNNVGMLVGKANAYTITDSYAIGLLNSFAFVDSNGDGVVDVDKYYNAIIELTAANVVNRNYLIETSATWVDAGNGTYTVSDSNIKTSYAIVNGITQVVGSADITSASSIDEILTSFGVASTSALFDDELGFNLTYGQDSYWSTRNWLYHDGVNVFNVGGKVNSYPMLIDNDGPRVMYDVLPTDISIIVNNRTGLYNITLQEDAPQVVMYLNKTSEGELDGTFYEISVDPNASISIKLSGAVIISKYVNIAVNDKVEFLENKNGSVIKLDGGKIYPIAPGVVTLTVRSYVSKSIKCSITILVVEGMTDYEICSESNVLQPLDGGMQYGLRTPDTVYIDETSDYEIRSYNYVDGIQYVANQRFGFVLELFNAEDLGLTNGSIKINGVEYAYQATAGANNIYVFNTQTFKVSGVNLGNVYFQITPFINLDVAYVQKYVSAVDSSKELNLNNVMLLSDLAKNYNINVLARARSVTIRPSNVALTTYDEVEYSITLETANLKLSDLGSNTYNIVLLEDIMLNIGDEYSAVFNLQDKSIEYSLSSGEYNAKLDTPIVFEYDLVNVAFDTIKIIKTNIDPVTRLNTYKITIIGELEFDRDYYRANANKYDLNSAVFVLSMTPSSNDDISATSDIVIIPNEVRTINTNFYSKGVDKSLQGDYETEYPEYNETSYIVPGRDGLLKITLDSEFNNSSYVTLTVDKKIAGYVTFQQLAAVVENTEIGGEILEGNILGYRNVTSHDYVETEDTYGIKLSKLSLNYKDNNYFSNTYYVRVTTSLDINVSEISLKVTSHQPTKNIEKELSLTVIELPYIQVTMDYSDNSVIGRGVKKALDISHRGLSSDVAIEITKSRGNADHYVYVADSSGTQVNSLSLAYLNAGGKYYLCMDVKATAGDIYNIKFSVYEMILGCLEESSCELTAKAVEFEIESVKLCGLQEGDPLILKHGGATLLAADIKYRDIVVGNQTDIDELKDSLESEMGVVALAEYGLAGVKVSKVDNGKEEILVDNNVELSGRRTDGSNTTYDEKISVGVYKGITLSQVSRTSKDGKYLLNYYEIKGTSISDNTYIRLNSVYYYNDAGRLVFGDQYNALSDCTIDLQIIVEDNSTYDKPTPIESQEDLLKYASVVGGNFILLNNLTLTNWTPVDAMFAALDGNGYTITIDSFDLSEFRGTGSGSSENADVGLFKTVSINTLLKNITVDVSRLLTTEQDMLNEISRMKYSSQSNYIYNDDIIDLGYISNLNFGVIAGTNNGAITNAKVISTKVNLAKDHPEYTSAFSDKRAYLHVLTTLSKAGGSSMMQSNIGGIVGVNAASGAITNSFVGISVEGIGEDGSYYIEGVKNPSAVVHDNSADILENIDIYPFVLAGGNNIGGIACENNGIISNTYTKGLGLHNPCASKTETMTGGLVAVNNANATITSCFVEGDKIGDSYRALETNYYIEASGAIGGFVYSNLGKVENSYTNSYIVNLSSDVGGFVYINQETGVIKNSYSTAVSGNSWAKREFTGVNQGIVQNFGEYINCYYLYDPDKGESPNPAEPASAIGVDNFDKVASWSGFAFTTGQVNADGIWTLFGKSAPRISTTMIDTVSFRKVIDVSDSDNEGVVYSYSYDKYYIGTQKNPLIVENAQNFHTYILDNVKSSTYGVPDGEDPIMVFGYGDEYATKYLRLVNNLDFDPQDSTEENKIINEHKGMFLYNIIFAGMLDGNGVSLNNLLITTNKTGLNNFGLFAQVGWEGVDHKTVIKNVNFNLASFMSVGNGNAGVIAGSIVNSSIVNVSINGNGQTVSALNNAGGLAGVIYSDGSQPITLIDITVDNIRVESTNSSLGTSVINRYSEDVSKYFFNEFTVEHEGTQSANGYKFKSLYVDSQTEFGNKKENLLQVSYAGGIAGVLYANNYDKVVSSTQTTSDYRTKVEESSINNLVVSGNFVISTADTAGGLFGYVGENTLVRESKFVLNADGNQLLKASNHIGGLVGEHHGVLEKCSIAHEDSVQAEYDNTILDDEKYNNGTLYLFDMSSGQPYYSVAIGGIAGSMENGVIIDSYSKVNVVKKNAYIAGGLVGYSTGYNHLGYVYSTGTVLGLNVTGGIIGYHVSDVDKNGDVAKLSLEQVFALTNWYNSNVIDVRSEISKRLYNNSKLLYKFGDTYREFYLKLPELGNAVIDSGSISIADGLTKDIATIVREYRINHDSYYVGSVIGKAMIRKNGNDIYNGATDEGGDVPKNHVFADHDSENSIFLNSNNNVFSTTLGMMKSSGDVTTNNRLDEFFGGSSFTVNLGQDTSFSSDSYRLAYSTPLNQYVLDQYGASDVTGRQDIFSYHQLFAAQEYRQQILGEAYSVVVDENGDPIVTPASTRNIFVNGYNAIERNSANVNQAFIQGQIGSSPRWELDNILPEFAHALEQTIVKIETADQLIAAFKSTASGKTYVIANDINLVNNGSDLYAISSTAKNIEYLNGIRSYFVAEPVAEGETQVTITIDVADNSTVNNIFNNWNGAIFQNLDFVININQSLVKNKQASVYGNYGLLANSLEGVTLSNCNFVINVDNFKVAEDSHALASTSMGLLFGSINGSIINGCSFTINCKNIEINSQVVTNFGLFAGRMDNTTITNSTFKFDSGNVVNMTLTNTANSISIGAIAGRVSNSRISNTGIGSDSYELNITDNYDGNSVVNNIGGLFGYAVNMTLNGKSGDNAMIMTYASIISKGEVNLGLIAGKSNGSAISQFVINKVDGLDYRITVEITGKINNLSVGGLIGYDEGYSKVGLSGKVSSSAGISVSALANNMNIGGIVGQSQVASQLASKTYFEAKLDVENTSDDTSSTTYVGGILGRGNGRIAMSAVVTSGTYNLTSSTGIAGVGGIIGGSYNSAKNTQFAVLANLNGSDREGVYISGVVGYNASIVSGEYGYTYVHLPTKSLATTSSITNGSIGADTSNVYYAQEFIGNNVDNDYRFTAFSIADVYGSISEYSAFNNMISSESGMIANTLSTVVLPIPSGLAEISIDNNQDKFKLVEAGATTLSSKYNVIMTSGRTTGLGSIDAGYIVAGRTLESGKVELSLSGSYFVDTNRGVISNLYLNVGGDVNIGNNDALFARENKGLITNCYVYGVSTLQSAIAETNSGRILMCGASIKYVPQGMITDPIEFRGLVNENSGLISDCYSESFGYIKAEGKRVVVYGFAKTNTGVVQHSTYYMPSLMYTDNTVGGIVGSQGGKVSNCYNSSMPSGLLRRDCVWTVSEDNHLEIVGMKTVVQPIVIKLKVNDSYIADVADLKTKLKDNPSAKIEYDYLFYSTEDVRYNIVKITSGSEFANYINALNSANQAIPSNTIVMIAGDIEVYASTIRSFSVLQTSALIGVGDDGYGITIDFMGTVLTSSLVISNRGLIANIKLYDVNFESIAIGSASYSVFAPISYNYGLITGFEIENALITSTQMLYVAGLVGSNLEGGEITNIKLTNVSIKSIKYVYYITCVNRGTINVNRLQDLVNITTKGQLEGLYPNK